MKVVVGVATDVGRVREGNEDSYLVEDPLFAVADGMGGHRGGEVASDLALKTVEHLFRQGGGALAEHVKEANRAVFERSQLDRKVAGMGTTLTAAIVEGERVRLAHVGDSRAYLLRDGELRMLTQDHTLVHRMIEQGEITEAEAESHPYRSVLTRALGVDPTVAVDEVSIEVRAEDRIMLCTDGLTGMVTEDEIRDVLEERESPEDAAEKLVGAANRAGGIDNTTVIVLDFASDESGERKAGAGEDVRAAGGDPQAGPDERRPRRTRARSVGRIAALAAAAVAVAVLGLVGLRVYLDSQWFVGVANGNVAVFRGIPVEVVGFDLNHPVVVTTMSAEDAKSFIIYQDIEQGITADDRNAADAIVEQIRRDLSSVPDPEGQP